MWKLLRRVPVTWVTVPILSHCLLSAWLAGFVVVPAAFLSSILYKYHHLLLQKILSLAVRVLQGWSLPKSFLVLFGHSTH